MTSVQVVLNYVILVFWLFAQFISTSYSIEMPANMKEHAKRIHERCQKQTGVPEELIRKGHEGNIPDDRQLKCYLHCLFDIVGLIDGDNVVHLEYLIDIMPKEAHSIIQNLSEKCGTQPGSDSCDTVYQTLKCYFVVDKISLMAAFSFLFD